MTMKVLVFTNLFPLPWEPNRATFNKQQFEALASLCEVSIIVPVAWPQFLRHRNELKASSLERVKYICSWYTPRFGYRWFGWFMWLSCLFQAMGWIKRQEKFDVVYGCWIYPDGFAAKRIANALNIPYVLKTHGSDINVYACHDDKREQIIDVLSGAANIVTVSNALKGKVRDLVGAQKEVNTIYNGVNNSLFAQEEESRNAISDYYVFVGNLKAEKGVVELLYAFEEYRQKGGEKKLKIVGDGACRKQVESMIDRMGLFESVDMLGAMPHKQTASLIKEAFCLVLPSYDEGVPNVLLEAAASGIPVIATRVGGIPEVVLDGVTGILIEPKDVDELTKSLLRVEQNQWDIEMILNHSQSFSWEKNADQLFDCFQRAVMKGAEH